MLAHVAQFGYWAFDVGGERRLAREDVARSRPFDNAGEVADAGVGEGGAHGDIGVGALFRESDGAELRE